MTSSNRMKKTWWLVAYLVLSLVIVIDMNRYISDSPIIGDAAQNMRMAYNLYVYNTISNDRVVEGNPRPTNYREPLPPILYAAYMYLNPSINKHASLESFIEGENTARIKQFNFILIFLLLLGSGLLIYRLTAGNVYPFLLAGFIYFYFIRFGGHFNSLYTELHAATLIIWTTYFLILSVEKRLIMNFLIAGILLGLLILTKAVFFYLSIFIVMIFAAGIFWENDQESESKIRKIMYIVLFVFGILTVISPWLIRNKIHFDTYEISQRGGNVLHLRAIKNQMTNDEIIGAFYYYGPETYKRIVKNTILGAQDIDFEAGGKYQRLKRSHAIDQIANSLGLPDMAISFQSISRSERRHLQNLYQNAGYLNTRQIADKIVADEAKRMILDAPLKHVLMSVPFFWRGIWCFPNSTIPLISKTMKNFINDMNNLLSYMSLFGIFVLSLYRKSALLNLVSIIPILMIIFYAVLSHNIPRYTEAAIPSLLVCYVYVIYLIISKLEYRFISINS